MHTESGRQLQYPLAYSIAVLNTSVNKFIVVVSVSLQLGINWVKDNGVQIKNFFSSKKFNWIFIFVLEEFQN